MTQILANAEPFLFPGDPTKPGILLIHGFTGTPQSLRLMGQYLNQTHGFTCLGIRLAGHATSPADLARTLYTDWMASVEDGFDLVSDLTPRAYLAGFSTGGTLALALSTTLPASGVIAMAAPFDLPHDWRLKVVDLVALFHPYVSKRPGVWHDEAARRQYVSYPSYPVRALGELNKLLVLMRARLPEVRLPVLLIHSREDVYPIPDSMPQIFELLGSSDKQALWIDHSNHLITLDAEREKVFRAAADFISRIESQGAEKASSSTAR